MEKNEVHNHPQTVELTEEKPPGPSAVTKKSFIEPEISVPVNVLEATTFFQLTDSGATN